MSMYLFASNLKLTQVNVCTVSILSIKYHYSITRVIALAQSCINQVNASVTNREAITDYGYFSDEAKKYRNEAQITQFRTHTTFALFVEHLMNTSYILSKFT